MGLAAVAVDGRGRLNVFVTGRGDGLVHWIRQNPAAPNYWDTWSVLGAGVTMSAPPVVGANPGRVLEVFGLSADGSLRHMKQDAAGDWPAQWSSLGAPPGATLPSGFAVAANPVAGTPRDQGGRLEVFAFDANGTLWHIAQQAAGQPQWSPWQSAGTPGAGTIGRGVAVGVNADGRLEAFTVAGIGELWHTFQRDRAGGPLSPWETLGRPSSGTIRGGPSIGTLFGGGLEVFVVGNDGTLQHRWQAPGWQSWAGLGRPKNGALGGFFGRVNVVGTPTAASNQDARVEVFARGTDGAIWHRWMDGTFNWPTGWALLGMRGNDMPTLVRNDDGTLALYTVATDGTVFHIWQQRANNGWGTWETLGNPSPPRVEDPPTEGTVDVTLHQKYTGSGIERVPVVGMCLGVVDQGTIPDAARVTTVTGTFVNSDGTQPGFPTHADPVTGRPAGGVQMQPGVPSSVFTGQRPWGIWEAQVTWQPPSQDVSGELQVTWKVP